MPEKSKKLGYSDLIKTMKKLEKIVFDFNCSEEKQAKAAIKLDEIDKMLEERGGKHTLKWQLENSTGPSETARVVRLQHRILFSKQLEYRYRKKEC